MLEHVILLPAEGVKFAIGAEEGGVFELVLIGLHGLANYLDDPPAFRLWPDGP
jgi:hypothetical protein